MKLKTTKKQIKEGSYIIIGVPYCSMSYLLEYENPFSYCCGAYGWSCDNYEIHTSKHVVTISTGYNYIESNNIIATNQEKIEIIRQYEEKARELYYNNEKSYEVKKNEIEILLWDCIDEIVGD